MKFIKIIIISLIFQGSLFAKETIITTFSVLQALTGALTKGLEDHFEIISLVPNGSDPHVFQPKPCIAKIIQKSSLVIINGLGFEEWLTRFIYSIADKNCVYEASKGVKARVVHQAKKPEYDPHAWHNVQNARIYIKNIHKALCEKFPQHKPLFTKNYQSYDKKLKKLEAWVKEQWVSIAVSKRQVVTTHDAFGYYAIAYNVKFISPVGLSTEQEPSVKQLANIITYIKKHKITALFSENMTSDRLLKQIGCETGNKLSGHLYADSLQKGHKICCAYGKTIRYNTTKLIQAIENAG